MRYKVRFCECGRELEKKCDYCSECGYTIRQIKLDIYRYNYKINNPEKVKEQEKKSNAKRYEYFKERDIRTGRRPRKKTKIARG